MHKAKIGIVNSSSSPRLIYVEPWANDYTLMPGEELMIEALGDKALPWFTVVEWDNNEMQVYCDKANDFKVLQAGVEIQCGHKRQPGSSAGPVTQP